MASSSNDWYFTKEQLESTPSRQCGVEPYKELSYRQQAANFIQDMGQKLKVSQLCINTAIVYMHRFYVFHSFTRFQWNSIAAAALFLAAKVEEQPRKLEHVIRVVTPTKNPHETSFDTNSERYLAQAQDLVFNENILLQTLGFDVAIDHPHTHVVRCCHLVRASKDLAQTSYFMASNREWKELAHQLCKLSPEQSGSSKGLFLQAYKVATKSLHLTTMCLQYKPTVVACFCIHFVCKWSNWEIPLSNEKKEWFSYVDETVTSELLEQLTKEFLFIYDRCSSRLKEKIMAIGDGLSLSHNSGHPSSPFEPDKKFLTFPSSDQKDGHGHRSHHGDSKPLTMEDFKQRPRLPHEPGSSGQHRDREREYREKKDRERLGHHIKPPPPNTPSGKHALPQHGHHGHPPVDPKLSKHGRPPSMGHPPAGRILEPRDLLREVSRDIGLRDRENRESLAKEALANREASQQVRASEKRDYMHQRPEVKPGPGGAPDSNSVTNYDKRADPNRPRPSVDPKLQARRREDPKPSYNKLENDIKKHLSAAIHEKNTFLHKPINSTSQKMKSPFTSDMSKSVPNQSITQPTSSKSEVKLEPHNGSSSNGGAFNLPIIQNDVKAKLDVPVPEDPVIVPVTPVKKPSLFSPEKSPPAQKKPKTKTPPSSDAKQEKVNQTSIAKELKPPDLIPPFNTNSVPLAPIMNGIETNPSLISSLLKEAPSVPHLPAVAATAVVVTEPKEKEQHHKEHKKNKKEKHKHKDKEKNREEKERKKKHKDKDREKHKHKHEKRDGPAEAPTQPIKITIPKDKIQPAENPTPSLGLKIKIPKDRIKTDGIGESSALGGGLKIKISKDVITSFNSNENSSRKRERDRSSPSDAPPSKVSKSNHNRLSEPKAAKNSYNKVSKLNNNIGDSAMHTVQTLYNGVNHMTHPAYASQNAAPNYYYNYPPPNMQLPMVPANMNVPPPFMYQQYYPPSYMYPSAELYAAPNASLGGEAPPPLPQDPPPNNPPPPPPDY